jgi:hypothetical protein
VLEVVSQGYSITRAARMVGISRTAVYEWSTSDPSFARDLDAAYEEGTDALHDAALDRALLPDHDGLLVFLLKMRDPARFYKRPIGEVTHTLSGDQSNPILVEHAHVTNGEDGECVHYYLPPNHRDQPDAEDEAPTIEGRVDDDEAAV